MRFRSSNSGEIVMLEATRVSLAVYSSAKEKGHARNDSEVMEMLRKHSFQMVSFTAMA